MKAVVYEKYGPPEVLQLREIVKPVPKDHEVLVKVHATTVTIGDSIMRSFRLPYPWWQKIIARFMLGVTGPRRKILGMELAGNIEATGKAVTRFKPGDAIFASTFGTGFGGYAEYKCLPETGMLALKPANLSYGEAAAAVGGGMTALRVLRNANIQPGQHVLIYGASGAVGTNAVQICKNHFGAQVTGVCSTSNLEMVKGLGADQVIDYTVENFTQRPARYDVVFDAVSKIPEPQRKAALNPNGQYLNVIADSGQGENMEELLTLKELLEAEKVKPQIDRHYSLDQIVDAHRYVDLGHKKGNVVITIAP